MCVRYGAFVRLDHRPPAINASVSACGTRLCAVGWIPSNGNEKIIKPDRVTQIFNTTIYGGSANVVGAASDSTVTFNIAPNDFASIQKVLKEHGVKDADILDLRSALESESLNGRDEGFGPKVSEWLGKMTQKAADGSWKIGLSAAGDLLARLVARYYGIGA